MERVALEHSERGYSMGAPKARELSVQEEEAALIAIGSELTWEPIRSSFASSPHVLWEEARVDTDQGYQMYDVTLTADYSPLVGVKVIYWKKNGRLDQKQQEASNGETYGGGKHWYNTIAEAKAACAVHAVTGEFPPSVELDESGLILCTDLRKGRE